MKKIVFSSLLNETQTMKFMNFIHGMEIDYELSVRNQDKETSGLTVESFNQTNQTVFSYGNIHEVADLLGMSYGKVESFLHANQVEYMEQILEMDGVPEKAKELVRNYLSTGEFVNEEQDEYDCEEYADEQDYTHRNQPAERQITDEIFTDLSERSGYSVDSLKTYCRQMNLLTVEDAIRSDSVPTSVKLILRSL